MTATTRSSCPPCRCHLKANFKPVPVLVLLAIWTWCAGTPCAAASIDVYVLAGQSNMDARAHRKDLPRRLQDAQTDVRFFFDDRWTYLSPGSSANPPMPDGFGPEISFGRTLADRAPAGKSVALIKHSKGGTDLARDWSPDGGPETRKLLQKVTTALEKLRNEGHVPSVRGFIWMQGERDATSDNDAGAYKQNLIAFIQHVRVAFADVSLPFVIGRIKAPQKPHRDLVRKAQETVANVVPDISWVDTDDLTLLDIVHYDARSLVELGRRFADAVDRSTRPRATDPR